ncbi:MAG TPA: fatty acid desaturase, partial [Anaerolineaceae bacterium]|nr:fatty acid desaturase [Anaerolineaceae bacterium]
MKHSPKTEKHRLPTMAQLKPLLAPYQKSETRHSILQLVNTLVPYILLWILMIQAYRVSFWLTLPLIILAAGFLIRIFIFFHDCGHNSFFPSTTWNKRVGFWLGVLTFTPSEHWWHSHAIHHATSGNLDKRGTGDVTTLTLEEYYDRELLQRIGYRFFRNPLVMFGLGPFFMFFLMHRFAIPNYGKKQTMNVVWTNLAILAIAVGMSLLIGWQTYLVLQLAVMWLAGS